MRDPVKRTHQNTFPGLSCQPVSATLQLQAPTPPDFLCLCPVDGYGHPLRTCGKRPCAASIAFVLQSVNAQALQPEHRHSIQTFGLLDTFRGSMSSQFTLSEQASNKRRASCSRRRALRCCITAVCTATVRTTHKSLAWNVAHFADVACGETHVVGAQRPLFMDAQAKDSSATLVTSDLHYQVRLLGAHFAPRTVAPRKMNATELSRHTAQAKALQDQENHSLKTGDPAVIETAAEARLGTCTAKLSN